MSEAGSPGEDEEAVPAPERDESKWSRWERQKLEAYNREHGEETTETPAEG